MYAGRSFDGCALNIENQRSALRQQLVWLDQLERKIKRFGSDEFEDGSVLVFKRTFDEGGPTYTYAAIKAGPSERWWLTGRERIAMTWEQLVADHLIDADEVWFASELEAL